MAVTPPIIDAVLTPGDCLYLPRGYLHAASALGDISTHLTIGIHTRTRHAVARTMLDRALRDLADDVDIRESLPLGVQVGEPAEIASDVERVRSRLIEALGDLSADDVSAALAAGDAASGRPEPIGPLAQLRATQALDADSVLVLRRHLEARLEGQDSGYRLVSRAGALDLGGGDAARLDRLLAGDPVTAEALGLDLARRLLQAGVAMTS